MLGDVTMERFQASLHSELIQPGDGPYEEAHEADNSANIVWVREAWNYLKEFSTSGNYIKFLTQDEGQERIESALGKNLSRLPDIRSKWDPENMFRTNRNIK